VTDLYQLDAIGILDSPFKEKFGIPRQSGLVKEAVGWIKMLHPYDSPEMFNSLALG